MDRGAEIGVTALVSAAAVQVTVVSLVAKGPSTSCWLGRNKVLLTMYHCITESITTKQPASCSRGRWTCRTVALDTEVYSQRTSVVVRLERFFHTGNSTVENNLNRDKDAGYLSEMVLAEVSKISHLFLLAALYSSHAGNLNYCYHTDQIAVAFS